MRSDDAAAPFVPVDPVPQGVGMVLFDGVCNLCNASVQFIIQRDPKERFAFASLQSTVGRRLLHEYGLAGDHLDSVVLLDDGRAYTGSDAALRIAGRLGGAWPAFSMLRIIPRFVREPFYGWIAANRYRWFGVREECMLPTPEMRKRFLD